jgi:CubicO group peptidase (beta-lactamase class C family)
MSLPRRPSASYGFRPGALEAADGVIAAAVRDRIFPGAVAAVVREDALVHLRAFGRFAYAAEASPVVDDTIYDLASLTKVLTTTTLAMCLVERGVLDVASPVQRVVPEFRGAGKDRVTIAHLLSHASGLPGWAPLFEQATGAGAILARVASLDLDYEPGTKSVYSDLGFILLGAVIERLAGGPLDALAEARVFGPLGMSETRYLPPAGWKPRIAPTEEDPRRGRLLQGEVDDENAFAMGGVAPHAGLFGTASDVARFVAMVLGNGALAGVRIFERDTLDLFAAGSGVPGSSYALGWDMPSGEVSSAGQRMSRRAIGHLGFTGTSFWIDRESALGVILLSNHVHPDAVVNAIPSPAQAGEG